DSFVREGRAEMIGQFAYPFPLTTIVDLMGIPRGEMERIKRWCDAWAPLMFARLPEQQQLVLAQSIRDYQRYIATLVEARRETPQPDFISALVHTRLEGVTPTTQELAGMIAGTIFAGHETTTCLLGSALRLLLEKPERWRALCEQPNLIPKAVE